MTSGWIILARSKHTHTEQHMPRHDATELSYERLLPENRPTAKRAIGVMQILCVKDLHSVFREYGLHLLLEGAPFLLSRSIAGQGGNTALRVFPAIV
jgi:hypothetical protein